MQNDYELKQSLFEWVAHLEEQRQQVKESKMAQAKVEKEQNKAKKARVNLLRIWSQRELSSDPASDSSDSEIAGMSPPKRPRYGKSRDHNTDLLIKTMRRNTDRLAAAVEKVAAAFVGGSSSEAGASLENRIIRVERRMEEHAEEINMLLRELLARIPGHPD